MAQQTKDPDYRPNRWIAVLDVESIDDETLVAAQERMKRQGVHTKVVCHSRKTAPFTLWRWGGWKS